MLSRTERVGSHHQTPLITLLVRVQTWSLVLPEDHLGLLEPDMRGSRHVRRAVHVVRNRKRAPNPNPDHTNINTNTNTGPNANVNTTPNANPNPNPNPGPNPNPNLPERD